MDGVQGLNTRSGEGTKWGGETYRLCVCLLLAKTQDSRIRGTLHILVLVFFRDPVCFLSTRVEDTQTPPTPPMANHARNAISRPGILSINKHIWYH